MSLLDGFPGLSTPTSIADGIAIIGTANQLSLGPLKAGEINAFLMGSSLGESVGIAGMKYAAMGGKLTKGIFVWKNADRTQGSLVFQMNPEEINDHNAPEYAMMKVPGQNRPQYHFISGGPRTITFALHFFYADRKRDAIAGALTQLRNLGLRERSTFSAPTARPGPPVLYFYFGEYYKGLRCILQKCEIKVFDLFDPATLLPMRATVEIQLDEVVDPLEIVGPIPKRSEVTDLVGSIVAAF